MRFDGIMISGCIISLSPLILMTLTLLDGKKVKYLLYCILALSAGALTYETCIRLIPFVLSYHRHRLLFIVMLAVALGIFSFLELLIWHAKRHKNILETNIILSIHNIVDGVALATAYLHSFQLGIITTFVLITHRLVIEIGSVTIRKKVLVHLKTISILIAEACLLLSAAITYFMHYYEVMGSPFIMATASVFFLAILYKILKKFSTLSASSTEYIAYGGLALIGYYASSFF